MIQDCSFDFKRDVQAVEQSGYIDLAKANATSSIPGDIGTADLQYNDIEDPRSIGGRPSDAFEAAAMAKSVAGYKAPSKDDEKE